MTRPGAVLRLVQSAIGEREDDQAAAGGAFPAGHKSDAATIRPADWNEALRDMRPASRVGPLFGVTARDLRLANLALSMGIPVYRGVSLFVKAILERFIALSVGLVLLPLILAIALAVRLSNGGPVLVRLPRIGKGGKPFTIYKFRTLWSEDDERGPDTSGSLRWNISEYREITPLGAFLRRTSLDELPQLWNVLKGDMSFVGPRPYRLLEEYRETPSPRTLLVRPGVTGLWQVSGRIHLSREESIQLDLQYAERWTARLDLLILWKWLSTRAKPV